MTVKTLSSNFFDWDNELPYVVKEKTPLQKLREIQDYSTLVLKAADIPSELVRATLNHSRRVLSSLTLDGSWKDEDFITFTAYMDNVTSLRLVNISFTDTAFDEAFVSELCNENPFEYTLDTYREPVKSAEPVELDPWESAVVILPRPTIYTAEGRLQLGIEALLREAEAPPGGPIDFFSDDDGIPPPQPSYDWDSSDDWWTPPPRPSYEEKKALPKCTSYISCPKLTELIIENPTGLTEGFLLKLLPIKDQLISLTLINCPQTLSTEDIRGLFPKLQTIVIS